MSASSLTPYIDPAGTGSVDIINRGTGGDEHRTYTDYEIIATPITGYRVERIEWTYTYEDLWNGGIKTESSWTAYSFFTFREDHNTDDFYHYGNYTLTSVSAYFVQGAPPPVTYRVTLDAQGGVGGTAYVDATVGSPMPSAVMPTKEGYTFSGYFTGTNGSGTKYYNADGSSARDWDLTSATTLHAYWTSATTYTITTAVSPSGAGRTTGGGTFNSGASCTLTATPASGYSFVRWEKNGAQVSTSASYSFTVTASAVYTAIFKYVGTVTITIQANDFGLVRFKRQAVDPQRGPIQMEVPINSPVTIEAFPRYNSKFKYWHILNGSSYYYTREITIGATGNMTVHAEFVQVIEAHARLLNNPDATCQFGEVRIVPRNESATAWGQDVGVEIHSSQDVYVQQRSTVVGWVLDHFWSKDTSTGSESSVYLETWSNVYQGSSYGYIVNALFHRTSTNLLVNSFNRSTPVQLVYDPETNKLVADY